MADVEMAPKGLEGVVVEKTKLSRVDGEKGVLVYCGYNIDELAKCSYEEICHLFLYGDLPTKSQLLAIEDSLKSERNVPKFILDFVMERAEGDHPMSILRSAVSMLTATGLDLTDLSQANLRKVGLSIISKTATIAAAICRAKNGSQALAPSPRLGHAANFLFMSRGENPNQVVAKTLDTALVLHADHSFNASTFTARVVASSLSDMVSAVTAAIGSLKGPLHGGANTAVMEMLMEIGELDNVESWLEEALTKKEKIMGFGHRVYKVTDPRAKHLKKMSKEWGERAHNVKWFDISERLEELMHEKKGMSANVDFYSASTYFAMGIPPEIFTVIFAMSRVVGWVAHYIEQLEDNRIMRPRAAYVGAEGKVFKPIEAR